MNEALKKEMEKEFKQGHKLVKSNQFANDKGEVELELKKEWLPYLNKEVHLLSPHMFHERNLVYLYVEECIQILPQLKEEGKIEKGLLSVIETLLLALDYLTQEQFTNALFTQEQQNMVRKIISECFSETKSTIFLDDANRPSLSKSTILEKKDKLYCLDEREEKIRIYLVVVNQKSESLMEYMKQIGYWLGEVNLKPNIDRISYEEALEGKTNHELHSDLLFYLNMVQKTFAWLLNSFSWRNNELTGFDEIDIRSKLGIR